ncbi:MAG: LytTR family DNA-binding domain-containing protein [Bryobacteraceae bacterium]
MPITAMIVDDEPLARQSIRRFLKNHPDIHVLGECGDGQSAVSSILADRPDLVFLDVQMPELDGFAVVNRIGVELMPATIFVTAYDEYAVRAFDANALDYLLKPFGKTRFERTLTRARERLVGNVDREMIQRVFRAVAGRHSYIDVLPVTENGRIVFVKTRDVQWIESAGNYARLHVASRKHEIRETLSSLEGRLNPQEFVRIHRSTIVNLHFVKEVHPWFHGYHLVVLEGGQELRMSRYQHEIAERLGLRGRLR